MRMKYRVDDGKLLCAPSKFELFNCLGLSISAATLPFPCDKGGWFPSLVAVVNGFTKVSQVAGARCYGESYPWPKHGE